MSTFGYGISHFRIPAMNIVYRLFKKSNIPSLDFVPLALSTRHSALYLDSGYPGNRYCSGGVVVSSVPSIISSWPITTSTVLQ